MREAHPTPVSSDGARTLDLAQGKHRFSSRMLMQEV